MVDLKELHPFNFTRYIKEPFMKPKFIFFTKTPWDEPPRIRHQLANLLAGRGFKVFFFEKPLNWPKKISNSVRNDREIKIIQYQELIHHKLRFNSFFHNMNASHTIDSISESIQNAELTKNDIIVNFNYEYYFLRKIFPNNKIVTIINDDFISRALFGYKKPLLWALERCLLMSNNVFTVSLPLQNDLKKYCDVELLMPWADRDYVMPKSTSIRKTLLFWGYINHRIDFALIEGMLNDKRMQEDDIKMLFVGPVARGSEKIIAHLEMYKNFKCQGATDLDRIDLDKVLAGINPYRENVPSIDATTLTNKAMQLLSRGLPLLISGMPNFINEPFVYRILRENPSEGVQALSDQFYSLQPIIKSYVAKNLGEARLKQLFNCLAF